MGIFTKEILLMTSEKVMDKCFGQMDHFIKETGRQGFKMEKDKFILQVVRL